MKILTLFFVLSVNFLFAQKTSSYTFYLCGNTFKYDSLSVYNELNGSGAVGPIKNYTSDLFTGIKHIERSEMQTEDPYNPGTFYSSTMDSMTTIYFANNVFDTLTFSSLKKGQIMYIVSGKDSFPVCEAHLKCDSCQSEYWFISNMASEGKKFYQLYDRNVIPEAMLNIMEKSESDKFFITEIYFWDWNKKKKINFDISYYVTK